MTDFNPEITPVLHPRMCLFEKEDTDYNPAGENYRADEIRKQKWMSIEEGASRDQPRVVFVRLGKGSAKGWSQNRSMGENVNQYVRHSSTAFTHPRHQTEGIMEKARAVPLLALFCLIPGRPKRTLMFFDRHNFSNSRLQHPHIPVKSSAPVRCSEPVFAVDLTRSKVLPVRGPTKRWVNWGQTQIPACSPRSRPARTSIPVSGPHDR